MPYCFDYSTGNKYYIHQGAINDLKKFMYGNWKDRYIIEAKMRDGKPSKDVEPLDELKGGLKLTEEQIDKIKPWIDNSILVGVRGDGIGSTMWSYADYSQPVFWTDKIPGQTERSDTTKLLEGDWVMTKKWGKGEFKEKGRIYKINKDGTYYIKYYYKDQFTGHQDDSVKSEDIKIDESKKLENEKGGSFWTFEDDAIKRTAGSIWINVTPILTDGQPYVADEGGREKSVGTISDGPTYFPYCELDGKKKEKGNSLCGTYLFKWTANVGDSAYRAVNSREGEKGGNKRTKKRKMNKRKKTRRNKNKRKTVKK